MGSSFRNKVEKIKLMSDLFQQGVAAYKAGKRDEARKIFLILVMQTPNDERTWEKMHDVSNNDQERIHCLKQILRINPNNEIAKKLLDAILASAFLPFDISQKNEIPTQKQIKPAVVKIQRKSIPSVRMTRQEKNMWKFWREIFFVELLVILFFACTSSGGANGDTTGDVVMVTVLSMVIVFFMWMWFFVTRGGFDD